MADELGPLAVDTEVFRGELPVLLMDVLVAQSELAAVAAAWLTGEVAAPLIQLQHLALKLRDLEAAVVTAGSEVNRVYVETRRRRDEAQAALS